MLCVVTWFLAKRRRLSAHAEGELGETAARVPRKRLGPDAGRHHHRRHLQRHLHADRGRRDGAVYAFFISVFVYKALKLKDVPRVLLRAANISAMLLYIITNAVLFSFLLTNENIPSALADGSWRRTRLVRLPAAGQHAAAVAGNLMEPSSIILIMAPILFPAAMRLGIDPVHFGILIDVNMEVGLCHPPVGLNLYVASEIAEMGITELTVAVWPWLVTMLVFLVIVTYWPELSLWLPRVLGMH